MISSLTFVFGFDQTFERFPRIWKFNKYFKKLHFYQNWSFYFQNIQFSYKNSRLVELIANDCTSWTYCNGLKFLELIVADCSRFELTAAAWTDCRCLQLIKNSLQLPWMIADKCNTLNVSDLMSADCNLIQLSGLVAIAETDCKWLQLIFNGLNYLNWLQLLKPISTDCNWLDLTYSGEFWNLNGHMIS